MSTSTRDSVAHSTTTVSTFPSSSTSLPASKSVTVGVFRTLLNASVAAAIAKTLAAPLERSLVIVARDPNEIPHLRPGADFNARLEYFRSYARVTWGHSFRGNAGNIWRYVPVQALNFTFNEKFRSLLTPADSDNASSNSLSRNICAGSLAGAASLVLIHPVGSARVMTSMDGLGKDRKYNGLIDCIAKTVKKRGWNPIHNGLYKNFSVTCAEIMIYRGVYFGIYNAYARSNETGFLSKLGIAYLSSTIALYAAYPISTIRRQMQMTSNPSSSTSVVTAVGQVRSYFGWGGFYRGSSYGGAKQLIFRSLSSTLTLVAFDYLIKRAEEHSKVSPK